MKPLVSVITPCRNMREYLAGTVQSVLAQTLECVEQVIVDDGSTDGSAELAAELALAHPGRIRLIRQEASNGNVARNAGARAASADHLYFLDADDILLPDALRNLLEASLQNPGHLIVGGLDYLRRTGTGWRREPSHNTPPADAVGWIREIASLRGFIVTGQMFFPRGVLERAGGWDETMLATQDRDLFLRAIRAGVGVTAIPGIVYLYRRDPAAARSIDSRFDDPRLFASRVRVMDQLFEAARQFKIQEELSRDFARSYFDLAVRHAGADTALARRCYKTARRHAGLEVLPVSKPQRLILAAGGYGVWRAALGFAEKTSLDTRGRARWMRRLRLSRASAPQEAD